MASSVSRQLQNLPVIQDLVVNRDRAIESLIAEFNDLIDLNKADVVASRLKHFNISNAESEDYCERVFDVKSLGSVLAGIRWLGGNREKPFLSIWPGSAITSLRDNDNLCTFATYRFKVFSPR